MDLPDCPPGAEGYEDSVVQVAKKPDDSKCTKAEQEFQDHLASLKIKLEDGSFRCMVERRGRDISGKWIYLCYPCAAVCSGESVLQTHISGKKHKNKLAQTSPWPLSIFEEHPIILSEKGGNKNIGATDIVLQKMAEEVDLHNKNPSDLDKKYDKYRSMRCHIQDSIDAVKAPLVGVEYLIEHPPEQAHYEPSYICVLCSKQGHPRTIINHLTCFWHKYSYLLRHFTTAAELLNPYRSQNTYREGVSIILNRIAQRIEDTYGRMQPVNIDKDEYERDKDLIHQWIYKSYHFCEKPGRTFEEVVDIDLINTISKSNTELQPTVGSTGEPGAAGPIMRPKRSRCRGPRRAGRKSSKKKDPSPPVVAAPTKPFSRGMKRAASVDSLSDISLDEPVGRGARDRRDMRDSRDQRSQRDRQDRRRPHFDVHVEKGRESFRTKYALKNAPDKDKEKPRPANYEYKMKLVAETRARMEESSKTMLAYHEKNPEKHPLYPEEWKKFWNRRYKEIQAEGKDAAKHDFKPEWIVFWTARMKELHDIELKTQLHELYRKMCISPPDNRQPDEVSSGREKTEPRRRSPDVRRRSPPGQRRSPVPRSRPPDQRRRSPGGRRRSPDIRARSPIPRRRSPEPRRRSPIPRRRTPEHLRERRSPEGSRTGSVRWSADRQRSPLPYRPHSRSPGRRRSAARTHITLESSDRDRSPLSQREAALPFRNRSPNPYPNSNPAPPSMQTVMVSDDELKPDEGLSPWNSDNESLSSLPSARSARSGRSGRSAPRPRSRTASEATSGRGRPRASAPQDLGPPENVVATLRLLVALEDYLGSLGPRIVDMLTEALTLEKNQEASSLLVELVQHAIPEVTVGRRLVDEKANSSEELLDRESAVVLMETAKEKLKGAVQAGLVGTTASAAVRAAVVRVAATLHAADQRAKKRAQAKPAVTKQPALPVAGVGEVDRAQIAQQMAAALIAQGKTDVSSEELAQLVDAVVGMAEAKKREAAEKKIVLVKPTVEKPKQKPAAAAVGNASAVGTASALQMLQSAYDENEKKVEKDEATDAMDGLSDSDLETLLKNFNELSAEEQHSLIAYLKKLEAKSPQRVERLRQYVTTAAAIGEDKTDAVSDVVAVAETVAILSDDDDDYTVDEVFESATLKVKEDQMRQEMEIVKKSLEELKPAPAQEEPKRDPIPIVEVKKPFSVATDILALVQASVQSITTVTDAVATDVVSSSSQPRSFGDQPESRMVSEQKSLHDLLQPSAKPFTNQQGGLLQTPTNVLNIENQKMDDSSPNNDSWNSRPTQGNRPMMQDNRPLMQQQPLSNRGPPVQGNRGPLLQDNRGPLMQDNRGPPLQDNRGSLLQNNHGPPMQDNRGPPLQDNRGPVLHDNRGPPLHNNRGPLLHDNREPPMQDNRGPPMQDNRGPPMQDNRGPQMQDNRGPPMQDNRGPQMQDNRGPPMQDNRGPPMQENRALQMNNSQGPPMQDNWGNSAQDNWGNSMQDDWGNSMQDNQGPPMQDNWGNSMQDNQGPSMQDNWGNSMQDNQGPSMQDNWGNSMQDNRGPPVQDNTPALLNRPLIQDNRGPMRGPRFPNQQNNYGPNQTFNQGPRGNFANVRMQDNFNQQNNFRGRGGGRGHYGGARGRGRGYY